VEPRATRLTTCQGVNPIGLPDCGLRVLRAFPFTQILVFEDCVMLHQFWPLGPDKTRFVLRMYFGARPDSRLEQFAEPHMAASTQDVLSEDVGMTGLQMLGMKGGGVQELLLGEDELAIRYTQQIIEDYLHERPFVTASGRDPRGALDRN
jgi:hypothetical protein